MSPPKVMSGNLIIRPSHASICYEAFCTQLMVKGLSPEDSTGDITEVAMGASALEFAVVDPLFPGIGSHMPVDTYMIQYIL